MNTLGITACSLSFVLIFFPQSGGAQILTPSSPPPRPRLLFTQAQIPALQARANINGVNPAAIGTPPYIAFQSFQNSPSPNTGWFPFVMYGIQELAVRYRLQGNSPTPYGDWAKAILLDFATPGGSYNVATNSSYISSYPFMTFATVFDLVHPLLSASERATVVNYLQTWLTTIKGSGGTLSGWAPNADITLNGHWTEVAAIAMVELAIWGEPASTVPNIVPTLQYDLNLLVRAANDYFDPPMVGRPGYNISKAAEIGYFSYGANFVGPALHAAQLCGFGDLLAGTNALYAPQFFGRALVGNTDRDSYIWYGDSSPAHKGLGGIDSSSHYILISRTGDPEAFWMLQRIENLQSQTGAVPRSLGMSFRVNSLLHYPMNIVPQAPEFLSGVARDNRNYGVGGSGDANRWTNFPFPQFPTGTGARILMHNSTNDSVARLALDYKIKDEWEQHDHQDDGDLGLILGGKQRLFDPGDYRGHPSFVPGAGSSPISQPRGHNIVLAQGDIGAVYWNIFLPPNPEGRFNGNRKASFVSKNLDYARGDHRSLWQMNNGKADRSVVLVKDDANPYAILFDDVKKDESPRIYEQLWTSSSVASGAGSASNPILVSGGSAGGPVLKMVYLPTQPITLVPGPSTILMNVMAQTQNIVRNASASAGARFLSVMGANSPSSVTALVGGQSNTLGGTLNFPGKSDKILVSSNGQPIADASTNSDARFVLIEMQNNALAGYTIGEGSSIVHNGVSLVVSSANLLGTVRKGRVDLQTEMAPGHPSSTGAASNPHIVLRLPNGFPPSPVVRLDGQAVPFVISGNVLSIGQGQISFTNLGGGTPCPGSPAGPALAASLAPSGFGVQIVGTGFGANQSVLLAASIELINPAPVLGGAPVPLNLDPAKGFFIVRQADAFGTMQVVFSVPPGIGNYFLMEGALCPNGASLRTTNLVGVAAQ